MLGFPGGGVPSSASASLGLGKGMGKGMDAQACVHASVKAVRALDDAYNPYGVGMAV